MTLPLWCLAIACLLPYGWLFFTGAARQALPEGLDNANPRDQHQQLTGVARRAIWAQNNAWEALPIFAAAVLTAHVVGADPEWSGRLAVAWVVLRLLHGVAYLANIHIVRSLLFAMALGAAMAQFYLAWQV